MPDHVEEEAEEVLVGVMLEDLQPEYEEERKEHDAEDVGMMFVVSEVDKAKYKRYET